MRGLIRLRGFGDNLARSFGDEAGIEEPAGDFGIVGAGHVDDDGGVWGDGDTGVSASVFGTGERGEKNAGGDAAVGERELGGGGGSKCGGNAGDNFEGNVVGTERVDFFGGAAEEERVTTFEADDDFVARGGVNEERVDVGLREEAEAGALADVDALGGGGDEREDLRADERIVEDDVGGLQEAQRFDGEEIGVTGAGADEIDVARMDEH